MWLASDIPTALTGWPAGLLGGVALSAAAWWVARRVSTSQQIAPPRPAASTAEAYRLLLEKILATTPALIVVLDREGRFIKFNQACVQLTGFEPGEVVGRPFWETVIPPEERDKLRQSFSRLITTLTPRPHENDWIDKQGRRHTVLWSNAVVKGAVDADTLIIATGIDVSESRRLQSELIHAQRMEAIGQLASGISHDFNNLLTAIFGHIALAKRLIPKTHAAADSLDRVEQAADQAGRVIRSLLTFSTNARSEKVPISVASLFSEAESLIDGLLPASIKLVTLHPPAGLWVKADRSLIEQALINLAINARDAMPTGGTLTLSARAGENSTVIFTVGDTGQGISGELLPRVMEPFFTTKSRCRGAGLGLPVARSIIDDHSGTLDLQSEIGRGTNVILRIPACEPPPEVSLPIKPNSLGLLVASTRTYPRQIMASSLQALGLPVRAVRDLQTLDQELRNGPAASVLIADISMLAGSSTILGLAAARGTQVLLNGTPDECAGVQSEAARTLAEPFSTSQLLETVRSLVNESAAVDPTE
jgi:PAS domain S-box-containing protein